MDFSDALRELKAGKRLRRASWQEDAHPNTYVWVELVDEPGRHPFPDALLRDGTRHYFAVNPYQLLAEDWEVVE